MSAQTASMGASSARERWRGLHPATRLVVVAIVLIVALELALAALDAATRGSQPSGPTSSSLSTAHTGLAAYAELLARYGHPVTHQRGSLASAHLDPSTTLVLLDPDQIDRGDLENVRRFLIAGGHLIAGGTRPEWMLELAPAVLPGWTPNGSKRVTVVDPASGTPLHVVTSGVGSWVEPGGVRSLVFRPGAESPVKLLADASPLQDRLLDTADNAAFGLSLAGNDRRPVVFAEGVHGYGSATGLAAIPFRWKIALVGVALAALLAMVAAGRRLGPPEDEQRRLPPPRRVYVDSMAAALARTHRPADALAPLQRSARDALARRAGFADDPEAAHDPARLRRAAADAGWPPDEIDALFAPLDDSERMVAAGRALARVHHGARRGTEGVMGTVRTEWSSAGRSRPSGTEGAMGTVEG
ncbi:MAG TPA: DUF4350 domain-containing protein [Acidimicrobiia bacterium]